MPYRILVVEDEDEMRNHIVKILKLDGYDVIEAQSGQEALEHLQELNSIDLVVSDIMMAEMSGLALFKEFKSNSEFVYIPFVFLTAMTHPLDIDTAQSEGVDAYITKPFEIPNLLSIVKGKIEKSNRIKNVQEEAIDNINNRLLMTFSHEFRTPLTLIIAYAEMLNEWDKGLSDDELSTFFNGVRSGANRMNRLVEKIVLLVEMFTKEGSKKYELWGEPIQSYDLKEMLSHAIDSVDHDEDFDIILESNIQGTVHGYDEYLIKAFIELIENGVKFSQDKTLKIRLTENKERLITTFENKSIELPDNKLDDLQKPFYQYNRDHYEFQGIGAGLSIVRGICEMHNATFKINQENETFLASIELPLI